MSHYRPQIPITEGAVALFPSVSLVVINSPEDAFQDRALTFHVHLQHQGGFGVKTCQLRPFKEQLKINFTRKKWLRVKTKPVSIFR